MFIFSLRQQKRLDIEEHPSITSGLEARRRTNMDVESVNDLDEIWTQVNVRASASSAFDNGDEDDDASSLVVISRSVCWFPIPCDC
jgi:hypothetical protein